MFVDYCHAVVEKCLIKKLLMVYEMYGNFKEQFHECVCIVAGQMHQAVMLISESRSAYVCTMEECVCNA